MKKNKFILIACILMLTTLFTACTGSPQSKEEAIELSDVDSFIESRVNSVLESYEDISLKKIEVKEDKLLLSQDSHLKPVDNIFADIYLDIDEEDMEDGNI